MRTRTFAALLLALAGTAQAAEFPYDLVFRNARIIGQGGIRATVVANRPATAEELERMKALVLQDMKDGAFGLSTGLFYVPGERSCDDGHDGRACAVVLFYCCRCPAGDQVREGAAAGGDYRGAV